MSPQCSQPDLQTALLNEARDAETLPLDLAQHLEECEACQTAAERLRRMVSVWEADHVDEEAMAAAAARFQARGAADHAGPRWFDVVPFASAGVAAGYLLLAATGAISLPWKSRPAMDASTPAASTETTPMLGRVGVENGLPRVAPVFAATDEGAKSVRARPHIETARGVAPLVNGLRLELKHGESARVTLADGHAAKVEGPCLVEIWSAPMEAGGWKLVREESTTPSSAVIEAPPSAGTVPRPLTAPELGPAAAALKETVTTQAQDATSAGANVGSVKAWARAAAALREDDFDAADRAFDELGHAADPATRDAARLARAQLWISRGRETAVRPVLEQLAQSGATALVRQRAAEFLHR
jgi:hypothetical protein